MDNIYMHQKNEEPEEVKNEVTFSLPELNMVRTTLSTWMRAVVAEMKIENNGGFSKYTDDSSVEDFLLAYDTVLSQTGLPCDAILLQCLELTNTGAIDVFGKESGGLIPVSRGGSDQENNEFPKLGHPLEGSENRQKAAVIFAEAVKIRVQKAEKEADVQRTAELAATMATQMMEAALARLFAQQS